MGENDTDIEQGDLLVFSVPRNDRILGTYLLTNRFFRYALAQSGVSHIARADDDTVFDAGAIGHLLVNAAGMPWGASEDLVFGPYGEWYMWNRDPMLPSCFAYYSYRWYKARQVADEVAVNASAKPLARWQYECVAPGIIGPFPYAKGPFVAYSRSVAAAISTRFDADERLALGRDSKSQMADVYGSIQPLKARRHPSKSIVYDDVYYSALVFELYLNRSLTLVRAPLSEYVKQRPMRLQPALVYHKLKHKDRFGYVSNHSELWGAGRLFLDNQGGEVCPNE
uniref:Uncharacterized protein n=1 Tax=Haptolina brevifila TaxID=156173 RepID=A0A7S2HZT9_9EUKA